MQASSTKGYGGRVTGWVSLYTSRRLLCIPFVSQATTLPISPPRTNSSFLGCTQQRFLLQSHNGLSPEYSP